MSSFPQKSEMRDVRLAVIPPAVNQRVTLLENLVAISLVLLIPVLLVIICQPFGSG